MRNYLYLFTLLFSLVSLADSPGEPSPDGKYHIYENCENEYGRDCTVYAKPTNGNVKTWIIKEPFPSSASIEWYNNELAGIKVSCGSPCNATFFFAPRKGVSIPYSLVLAVDISRQLVAVPEYDEKLDVRSVKVFSIFSQGKSVLEIKRNFSAYIQFVEKAEFDEQGNLHLSYWQGSEAKETTKEIVKFK